MKKIESKVGIEAEFLLFNDKGEMIIPPSYWDRDGFPLLGEIRGKEGKSLSETLTNFERQRLEIIEKLSENSSISMVSMTEVPLALYKKANQQANWEDKEAEADAVKNIYGTDIAEFSDQIVKNNKIQGVRVSCGLHIHFSCGVTEKWEYQEPQYELVTLPLALTIGETFKKRADFLKSEDLMENCASQLMRPTLYLYAEKGYEKKKEIEVHATRLNKPAIEYIVRTMDEEFFSRFAPDPKHCTKFRQPGFFELKPYGFEYRSLPANSATMAALPDITKRAFALLDEVNEY